MRYLRDVSKQSAMTAFQSGVIANLHSICEIPNDIECPASLVRDKWKHCPDVLVFQNGVLTFEANGNRRLTKHRHTLFSTILLPFKYDPQATCSRWESFITEVLPDSDCQRLIQEIFGYCLTYDLSQQKFVLFLGDGGNGKGVITRTLRTLLGEDNVSTVPLTHLGKRFYLVGTMGKLVNFCNEVDSSRDLDEAVIKQFTGEDPMQFEQKYQEVFSAMPTAKLIISGNAWLPFRDRSEGIWRRLVPLHFPVNIPEAKQNKNLTRDLLPELSGIFNWAVEGFPGYGSKGDLPCPLPATCSSASFGWKPTTRCGSWRNGRARTRRAG